VKAMPYTVQIPTKSEKLEHTFLIRNL